MEALPGREGDAESFLGEAVRRQMAEPGTLRIFAMRLSEKQFAVFSTFENDQAMIAHVNGPVAAWIEQCRPAFFVAPYNVTQTQIFALKDHDEFATYG